MAARSGSRYRTVSPRSWADWARWVPQIEPEALLVARTIREASPTARFFIWGADDEVPDDYACAVPHVVALFDPPRAAAWASGWMRHFLHAYPGYPPAVLYRLPDGCPSGYDPTRRAR